MGKLRLYYTLHVLKGVDVRFEQMKHYTSCSSSELTEGMELLIETEDIGILLGELYSLIGSKDVYICFNAWRTPYKDRKSNAEQEAYTGIVGIEYTQKAHEEYIDAIEKVLKESEVRRYEAEQSR